MYVCTVYVNYANNTLSVCMHVCNQTSRYIIFSLLNTDDINYANKTKCMNVYVCMYVYMCVFR